VEQQVRNGASADEGGGFAAKDKVADKRVVVGAHYEEVYLVREPRSEN
jgi:hypothetical protein